MSTRIKVISLAQRPTLRRLVVLRFGTAIKRPCQISLSVWGIVHLVSPRSEVHEAVAELRRINDVILHSNDGTVLILGNLS